MGIRDLFFVGVVAAGVATLGAGLARSTRPTEPRPVEPIAAVPADLRGVAGRVDAALRRAREADGLPVAPPAPDLAVLRRLTLALTGTIPSLEEIRRFEARPADTRVEEALDALLRDRRSADYLAERLARAYVGTEDGPFIQFRRRRFVSWLGDAIEANRPYDAIVRDLIADTGLWTDHPATNFVTVTFDPDAGKPDPERLAARVSRAFLGKRIDCAQCHDHPFQPWTQGDFRGLAAFFGGARTNLRGITDGDPEYRPADRKTKEPTAVEPRVPSHPELCPDEGNLRQRLAGWIADPRNPALARATTNRVWALLFGRPLVDPVDDLPEEADLPEALTILADDFAAHGYDLRRLIAAIARTESFRLDSASDPASHGVTDAQEAAWAAFPISRLRPEQVAGAVDQAASVATLGPDSHWLFRLIASTNRGNFVRRYGDTGADEFDARGGTIPQRLLLMNGDLVRDRAAEGLFTAASRIASQAPDDAKAVEAAYLAILTRRPSPEEAGYFAEKLAGKSGKGRTAVVVDLCWTLLNATEFSWNH